MLSLEELLASINSKRVPELRTKVSQADLVLQEQDVHDSLRSCKSFDDIDVLVNKMLVYMAMAKAN